MENYLRSRVRDRLEALGINAFEAARRIGVERTFLADLLSGKKDTIRPRAIAKVAEVLDCDPEFLIGAQATPRRAAVAVDGTLPLAGICEAGVWRSPEADATPAALPIAPDPRFPRQRQAAYLIRGHHADELGLMDGDVLVAVADEPVRECDVVILRRIRDGGERELRAARLTPQDDLDTVKGSIVGRVIAAHRVF